MQSVRCQVAAYAYMHRFEAVLDAIEHDGYLLQTHYTEGKGQSIEMIGWAAWMAFKSAELHLDRLTGKVSINRKSVIVIGAGLGESPPRLIWRSMV